MQHAAGIDLHAKPGDTVTAGQPLFTMSANQDGRFRALEALEGASGAYRRARHRNPDRRSAPPRPHHGVAPTPFPEGRRSVPKRPRERTNGAPRGIRNEATSSLEHERAARGIPSSFEGTSITDLPKVSLHDHLDGGLRTSTILEIADEIGLDTPADDPESLQAWFDESCDSGDLVDYLKTFDLTIAVMQTPITWPELRESSCRIWAPTASSTARFAGPPSST